MITLPLVVILGFVAWLMVRRGGWRFAPLGLGMLLGLLIAATPFGPELTNMINQIIHTATNAISNSFGGAQ